MKRLFLLLAILASAAVTAATLNSSWINATKNIDGTDIPATGQGTIASTRIVYGTCNSAGTAVATVIGEFVVQGQAQSGVSPDVPPGTYCGFAMHKNGYGSEGPASNVSRVVKAAPTPGAPSNFSLGL